MHHERSTVPTESGIPTRTPRPETSPASRLALALAPALLLLAGAGCAPNQAGTNQCPEVNQSVTAVKDAGFGTMPSAVDAVVAAYLAGEGAPPGCAVGIMQNNAVAYLKGYGLADLENERPFTHTNAAVVGSVSKTWTALTVLRLMELGYLGLDDPIADHLAVPAAWSGLTIRQLLSHTAGLQRDPTFHPLINDELELSQFWFPFLQFPIPQLGIHPRLVLPSYLQTPVVGFEPGATAEYSNTGYMILGALIDTLVAANEEDFGPDFAAYESFVWRQVGFFDGSLSNGRQMLTPCLDEYWRQADIPYLVKGYTYDGNDYVPTTFFNSSLLQLGPAGWEGPPGGWTMTIGDVVRLMMAIQNNDVISAATRDQEMMQSYGQTVDGNGNVNGDWGLGVSFAQKLGRPVYLHDGKYPGYRARYTVWPGENFGVAIMANESDADMRSITDAIAAVFIGNSAGDPVSPASANVADETGAGPNEVVDDDPGLGGTVGRAEPVPFLSDADRFETFARWWRATRHQWTEQERRERIEEILNEGDCREILDRLAAKAGISLVEEWVGEADGARNRGEWISRMSRRLSQLGGQGLMTPREMAELKRCVVRLARLL